MIDENEFVIFGWLGICDGGEGKASTNLENVDGRIAINKKFIIGVFGSPQHVTAITYIFNNEERKVIIEEPFDSVMKHLNKRSQFQSIPSVKKCSACHDFPFFEWLDCRGENHEETYSVICTCGFGKKLPFPVGSLAEIVKNWNEFCGEQ